MLTRPLAEALAGAALGSTTRAYPYKLDQLLTASSDLAAPQRLHPAFWGSYDWHSSVHMHWTLVRVLRRFPDHSRAQESRAQLATRLTTDAIAGELATLRGPNRQAFERPYGWAWLLELQAEALRLDRGLWGRALAPN